MDAIKFWNDLIPTLKKTIGLPSYKAYISKVQPVYVDDEKLVLLAENKLIASILNTNMIDDIANSAYEYTGVKREVIILDTPEDINTIEIKDDPVKDDSSNKASGLNDEYTFENFVVGNSYRFVYDCCKNVAKNPGMKYNNPLFIYGGVGLGKTHLIKAIGHSVLENFKDKKVVYVTSEQFTNELINMLRTADNENFKFMFRNKYRKADVLIVDDIQFIAGKESVMEEFFHTFNDLRNANKQIIISGDKQPKDIPKLEERLISRFKQGLTVSVDKPDKETLVAIILNKVEKLRLKISMDIAYVIAESINSNIREVEGAISMLYNYAQINGINELNDDKVCEILKDMFQMYKSKTVTVERIMEKVADEFGIKVDDLIGKGRKKEISLARQVAMYLCKNMTDLSYAKIGEDFGGRDHSTILHGCTKIENDIEEDIELKIKIEKITSKIEL